jgi:hypothetical protein
LDRGASFDHDHIAIEGFGVRAIVRDDDRRNREGA